MFWSNGDPSILIFSCEFLNMRCLHNIEAMHTYRSLKKHQKEMAFPFSLKKKYEISNSLRIAHNCSKHLHILQKLTLMPNLIFMLQTEIYSDDLLYVSLLAI